MTRAKIPPHLCRAGEAAKILGISVGQVRRLANIGQLRTIARGSWRTFVRAEVLAYKQRSVAATPQAVLALIEAGRDDYEILTAMPLLSLEMLERLRRIHIEHHASAPGPETDHVEAERSDPKTATGAE